MMPDIVDTDGETVNDTEPAPKPETFSNIDDEHLPAYTIIGALDWLRRPENDAQIREFGRTLDRKTKDFVQGIDHEVSKVTGLMRDMAVDEKTSESVFDSFLRSITGIED